MVGCGVNDAEYATALRALEPPTPAVTKLLERLLELAPAFPHLWNPTCNNGTEPSFADDGYAVDPSNPPGGSSAINEWRLAAAQALDSR
jgi:hypothetical protein